MTALEIAPFDDVDNDPPPVAELLLRLLNGEGRSWTALAACRDMDPEIFFPTRGQSANQAKAACARCVVREECLEEAMATKTRFGIWGGTSERERRRIRAQLFDASASKRAPLELAPLLEEDEGGGRPIRGDLAPHSVNPRAMARAAGLVK